MRLFHLLKYFFPIIFVALFVNKAYGKDVDTPLDSLIKAQFELCYKIGFQNDSFRIAARKYQELVDQTDDTARIKNSREILVYYFYQNGILDSLQIAIKEAKAVMKKYDDTYQYFFIWAYLLSNYNLSGRSELAISEAKLMWNEAVEMNYPLGIAISQEVIGDSYLYMNNYVEALSYYNKAYELYSNENGENFQKAQVTYSSLVSELALKNYNLALEKSNRIDSLMRAPDESTKEYVINSFLLISSSARTIVYSKLGNLMQARAWLDSMEVYHNKGNIQDDFYNEAKGTYFETIQVYDKAIEAYTNNINFYQRTGLIKEMNRFLLFKARVQAKARNYTEACRNYDRHAITQDSLNSANTIRQLNEFAVIRNLDLLEIDKKNLEIKVQQKNSLVTSILLVTTFSILIILGLSFIIQRRLYNKLKNSEKRLQLEKDALCKSKEDLLVALEKAESSDRLKSAFLANVSHEIRTPLNAIVGFSSLLKETNDPAKIAKLNSVIEQSSDSLLKLIDNILYLSNIESKASEIVNESINISELIGRVSAQFKQKIHEAGITYIYFNPYKTCIAWIEKKRFTQIIISLLNNSIQFTKQGEICIGYTCRNDGIELFVRDSGIGISTENLDKIFERFYKVDMFTQGTGLGLPIVKAITDSMGGSVDVESEVDVGSTFTVFIPCKIEYVGDEPYTKINQNLDKRS